MSAIPSLRRGRALGAAVTTGLALLAGSALAGPVAASAPTVSTTSPAAAAAFGDLRSAISAGATRLRAVPFGTVSRGELPPGASLRSSSAGGQAALTAAPVSRFTVNFRNDTKTWTAEAKASFQAAVDIWSRSIESKVPVVINATATTFSSPDILGGAGPTNFQRNDQGTGTLADDVFEPYALYNARTGRDANPSESDIEARFNPSISDLYLGTDGKPGANQIDFRSIVLHELGHGLGLIGTASVLTNGSAVVGDDGVNNGTVRSGVSYDELAYATTGQQAGNGGQRVLNLADGSAELKTALTGGQLYWAGQQARTSLGGAKVRLYAPPQWSQGTSYGHVDESTYPGNDADGLMTPFIANGQSFAVPGDLTLGIMADMGYAVPALTGSRYTAVDPVRVLDTRDGTGAPKAVVKPAGVLDLKVTGVGGVPDNATAVVLNVTGVSPSQATDVRVYPTPVTLTSVPEVSNLNLAVGLTRANLVTVPVGNNGRVRLRNNAGTVSLLADLSGFYAPAAAATFTPVDPVRLLDTRSAVGTATKTRVPAGGLVDLKVAGVGPVPADATAVALTVTAVNATQSTDVRVYPAPTDTSTVPTISNVNLGAGPGVPNVVIVKVGAGGAVRLRNSSGEVHLLADVAGYYSGDANGSLFRAVSPLRVLDTRSRLGTASSSSTRVGPGGVVDLRISGVAQVPSTARAAVLTVTGVTASASTDVRVYPPATSVPTVSNLNLAKNQTAADLVVVKLANGLVRLRNNAGSVALLADVSGWFGPA